MSTITGWKICDHFLDPDKRRHDYASRPCLVELAVDESDILSTPAMRYDRASKVVNSPENSAYDLTLHRVDAFGGYKIQLIEGWRDRELLGFELYPLGYELLQQLRAGRWDYSFNNLAEFVFNITLNKCRSSRAKVLSIIDLDSGKEAHQALSRRDENFVYTVGDTVIARDNQCSIFAQNRLGAELGIPACGFGIHYFAGPLTALCYLSQLSCSTSRMREYIIEQSTIIDNCC